MAFISDNLKTAQLTVALAAPGAIGTAPLTVDIASTIAVNYTGTANGVITVPTPTDIQAGDRVSILNVGSQPFVLNGDSIPVGYFAELRWSGTAWIYQDGGRNAGVSVPIAAVPAGVLNVTHNLAMPTGQFSSVIVKAYNTLGNEIVFRRNKAGDTANVVSFSVPSAITTNLPITFDIIPLA